MANTLRFTLKTIFSPLNYDILKLSPVISQQTTRLLYAKSTLGIEAFNDQRKQIQKQMEHLTPKFRERMTVYTDGNTKNMIFTEDLKNMIHLAENDADFDLVIRMAKKFNSQNKELRFGNFVFGPIIMRLFHVYNQPDLALECFQSPELDGILDQLITYQILLDLLYENGRYQEMLDIFEIIKTRQLQGAKYPRNAVVLVMAACYKMNSKESLAYALKLWNELAEAGHLPMRRATTFCAGLALNQGRPEVALEILAAVRKPNYVTIRNLKAKALSDLGRLDDAIVVLKSVLTEDRPGEIPQTFNRDVIDSVKVAVLKADNPEITLNFQRIETLFEQEKHISQTTLDEQLCSEIQQPPVMNNRQPNRFSRYEPPQTRKSGQRYPARPGLKDLV